MGESGQNWSDTFKVTLLPRWANSGTENSVIFKEKISGATINKIFVKSFSRSDLTKLQYKDNFT